MLDVCKLTVQFGGLVAVREVSLNLPETGVFALVGPNGAGKTTLLNALSRICTASAGTVRLGGIDVLRVRPHEAISVGIARSFQRAELFPSLTIHENLMVGLHASITTGVEGALLTRSTRRQERLARQRADAVLRELNMSDLSGLCPTDLPYGHQKLLDIGRAMISTPKLLLLDEPFAGLTEAETPRLLAYIKKAGQRCTVLMVEHHIELFDGIVERVAVMNFGRKIAEGTPSAIRSNPEVIECYLGAAPQKTTEISAC